MLRVIFLRYIIFPGICCNFVRLIVKFGGSLKFALRLNEHKLIQVDMNYNLKFINHEGKDYVTYII